MHPTPFCSGLQGHLIAGWNRSRLEEWPVLPQACLPRHNSFSSHTHSWGGGGGGGGEAARCVGGDRPHVQEAARNSGGRGRWTSGHMPIWGPGASHPGSSLPEESPRLTPRGCILKPAFPAINPATPDKTHSQVGLIRARG